MRALEIAKCDPVCCIAYVARLESPLGIQVDDLIAATGLLKNTAAGAQKPSIATI